MVRPAVRRLLLAACLAAAAGWAAPPARADAADLRERYVQLQPALRSSPFGRPLHIESLEARHALRGAVNAVVDHPFERVRDALRQPAGWCDIMILPFNSKYCHAVQSSQGPALVMRIGRRYDQPVERAFRLVFDYQNVAATQDYFESQLSADKGPVGTRDYRIVLSAIPVEGGRTFMRLDYSYGAGMVGRVAMRAYLATAGADKVGFTVLPRDDNGEPRLIGGMRGAIERNAMRYYLAIDAFLDSLDAPPAERAERRIQAWFTGTERHPRQLREMDRETYVAMKRVDVERQKQLIE